jgi:2-isopropylmalate synthase
MKKIIVSDATLKVANKKGLSLSFREKLAIAEKLDALGLDAIELTEILGQKENEIICRTIASTCSSSIIKVPVGDTVKSIEETYSCVKCARKLSLQVVMPVSTALMEYNYHKKSPQMLETIVELVKCASNLCDDVEFVAIDAMRAESGFLSEVAKAVYDAGAKTFTLSDDEGTAFPIDFKNAIAEIKKACPIKIGVSPSNSLQMAMAIAIESINAGADCVKTSIYEDTLSLATFSDVCRAKQFDFGFNANIDHTSVKTVTQNVKEFVEDVKNLTDIEVKTLTANSTIKDLSEIATELGYELSDEDLGKVFDEIKKLTLKKEIIDDPEIEAVIATTAMQVPSTYHLVHYVVNSGNVIPATANIILEKDGQKYTGVSTGDGPIDAAFHAIEQIIGHHYELDDFKVSAVTKGRGAVGSSLIRLRANGKLYSGNGVSTDIIGACIRAFINAVNKIVYEGE